MTLAELQSTSLYFFEPNVHFVRSVCLMKLGYPLESVEQCLHASADAARRMGADLLASRATDALQALRSNPERALLMQ